jgi:dienelactone hydrolase
MQPLCTASRRRLSGSFVTWPCSATNGPTNLLTRNSAALGWSLLAVCVLVSPVLADESKSAALPYSVAHNAPLHSSEQVVKETSDYKQLRIEFDGINADRVPGFLYLPQKEKLKRPAVLLQYGSGGHKNSGYIVEFAHQFVARGFVVLTIDAPLRGERAPKEKRAFNWLDLDLGRNLFVQYLGDYSRAVDYLVTRPEVDPERIGYVGISWGAITGITYVAYDPRIKTMVSMVGGGNLMSRLPGEVPDKLKEIIAQLDPVNTISRVAPRPLLLLNVTHDQLIPRLCAEAIHKAAGKGAKVVWLETDHYFRGEDRTKLGDLVIEFLEKNLPAR